jgi:hypothetical protein
MDLKRVIAITELYQHGFVRVHEKAVWFEGDDAPYAFYSKHPLPQVGELVEYDYGKSMSWKLTQYDKYEMPTKLHKLLAGVE